MPLWILHSAVMQSAKCTLSLFLIQNHAGGCSFRSSLSSSKIGSWLGQVVPSASCQVFTLIASFVIQRWTTIKLDSEFCLYWQDTITTTKQCSLQKQHSCTCQSPARSTGSAMDILWYSNDFWNKAERWVQLWYHCNYCDVVPTFRPSTSCRTVNRCTSSLQGRVIPRFFELNSQMVQMYSGKQWQRLGRPEESSFWSRKNL